MSSSLTDKLYAITDKGPFRALSLVLALILGGLCFLGTGTRFAAKTSSAGDLAGLLLIWAVCAGVIHGLGFRPHKSIMESILLPVACYDCLSCWFLYFL
jgi:cyd operon protein YbgE